MATNNSTNNIPALPLTVPTGGGATSYTAFAPIVAGTTSTGLFQSASVGQSNVGYVFSSNGAAQLPSFQSVSGSMVLVQTLTANNTSPFLAFTGLSGYSTYLIVVKNLVIAPFTSAYFLGLRVSTDNGATYLATNYKTSMISWTYDGVSAQGNSGNTRFTIGYGSVGGNNICNGAFYLKVGSSIIYPALSGAHNVNQAGFGEAAGRVFGMYLSNVTVNAFRVYTSTSSNIISGSVSVYGLKQ